jgi:sugar (pentulose or hexulose) kinase
MTSIAIFDIGKTNKKLFLFDEAYNLVYEQSIQIPEIKDEDGDTCDDLEALTDWVKNSFGELVQNPKFNVKALNFSGFGASFVHLGKNGKPVAPLYSYLKPFPADLKQKFYAAYGDEQTIARQTTSPDLGNLNSAMQIFMLKYARPHVFTDIAVSMHLPQYLSSIFTGHYFSDITSVGCHTRLWDFEKGRYHDWVLQEKLTDILAPIAPSDSVIEVVVKSKKIQCGIGLHDSSAALIPYLQNFSEPFVLISTGTWCISLNPFNQEPLTDDELRQDCLCYLSYQGKSVKASRLFSGHEHEQQTKRLAAHFQKPENAYVAVKFNPHMLQGTAPFADNLSSCDSYDRAYHALILSLVQKQVVSTNLVLGQSPIKKLFVDGGFSKNPIFMSLLANAYPKTEVYAASMAQASALGSALAIHRHWNSRPTPDNLIEYSRSQPVV